MQSPFQRRLRASPFLVAALWAAISVANAGELVGQPVTTADYATVRQALVEAIEAEGLISTPPAQFGEMLQRTEAGVGHGGAIYAQAEIFSFCSIAVAARLVREDPERIADCPLTIALYRLKERPEVRLVYRRRDGDTPGSQAANAMLGRIVDRTLGLLPAPARR